MYFDAAPGRCWGSSVWKRTLVGGLLTLGLVGPLGAQDQQTSAAPTFDWREQNAYTLGVQAYLYGFPWAYMPDARWTRTEALDHQANRFDHIRQIGGREHLTAARQTTTRCIRALGSTEGRTGHPLRAGNHRSLLHDGDRRFHGRQFRLCRTRATGTKAGNYAIIGRAGREKLPDGVTALPAVVDALGDHSRAHIRQGCDRPRRTRANSRPVQTHAAVSEWGKAEAVSQRRGRFGRRYDPKTDPLAEWKTINRAMIEVPPPAREADMLQQFACVGIGPGLDVEAQDRARKRGLARAAVDGKRIIAGAFTDGVSAKGGQRLELSAARDRRPSPRRGLVLP